MKLGRSAPMADTLRGLGRIVNARLRGQKLVAQLPPKKDPLAAPGKRLATVTRPKAGWSSWTYSPSSPASSGALT